MRPWKGVPAFTASPIARMRLGEAASMVLSFSPISRF
jgi:hypothetical protein